MAYGPNRHETAKQLAIYVNRILKGAKPADLPVRAADKVRARDQCQNGPRTRTDDSPVAAGAGRRDHPVGGTLHIDSSRTPESDIIGALGLGNGSRCRPVGGTAMPVYEYHCDKCQRAVTLTLSIREHEKGKFTCPTCGSKALRPLVSTFFSQTSRKS